MAAVSFVGTSAHLPLKRVTACELNNDFSCSINTLVCTMLVFAAPMWISAATIKLQEAQPECARTSYGGVAEAQYYVSKPV
jgi:hypothetical protein